MFLRKECGTQSRHSLMKNYPSLFGRKVEEDTKTAEKEREEGDDVEDAEEISYTSYRPGKLKYGKDHPGPCSALVCVFCKKDSMHTSSKLTFKLGRL